LVTSDSDISKKALIVTLSTTHVRYTFQSLTAVKALIRCETICAGYYVMPLARVEEPIPTPC
jgi:hypothetical protein